MNVPTDPIAAAIDRLTGPGASFELTEVSVGGRALSAYRHAPSTLPELLNAARAHGAKEFMAYEGERWSFERFFAAADALAGRLQAQAGVKPGDRVAIVMRNRPEWAVAFAAAALVGAVPAALNSFGQREELRSAIADVAPKVLVCDDERLQRLEPGLDTFGCRIVVVGRAPAPGRGLVAWADATAPGGPARTAVKLHADDPALLLFTSGSSSRPKAVLSSQRAVCQALANIDFIGALSALTSPKVVAALMARGLAPATLTVVPLFHVSGLHAQLLTTLRNGRRLVFMHKWNPQQALQTIRDERITQFNAAPSMVMQLLETPGFDPRADAASLGGVGFGGAGLPQRLIEEVMSLFPDSMSGIGFGLTETNGVGTAISGTLFAGRPRSSGLRSPLMEVRIADDAGNPQPPGQAGEVWLRGVTVMQEYWGQPEATAAAMVDGWFRTGDVGYLDDSGFLFIVDRIKDVINRSGEKIAAAEVESCLLELPAVEEAAVIAAPDTVTGEAIVAVVVPRAGESLDEGAAKAHVAARLASYKVPARVIVRAEPLPRTATGKVVKGDLKAAYAQG